MPDQTVADPALLRDRLLAWYDVHARDLPWREPSASPWAVMVSEFMLQQTPVARVLPVYEQWLTAWPTPADLAATSPGDAVRAWGRLGYPRRALRLHAAATAIVERHGGTVPTDYADLIALPGVGDYTAAAIASFAFRRRHVVLDTNVRRVLAAPARRRVPGDRRDPRRARARDRAAARRRPTAAAWAVATMELGATVCVAATRAAPTARWRTCARGGRPATRRTTDPRGAARPTTAPPAVPRPAARRAPRQRRAGAPQPARGGVGRRRAARPVPCSGWSTTAWWPGSTSRPTRCPERARRYDDASARSSTAWSSPGRRVQRHVELEAHEGRVQRRWRGAARRRAPGAREVGGDRRDPHGVGLAHDRA